MEFDTQIRRLNGQWKGAYGEERKALLWTAFRDVPADDFRLAVDNALAKLRSYPLVDELSKEVDLAKLRRLQAEVRGGGGFNSNLDNIAKITTADRDFVRACAQLRRDMFAKKITQEQFLEGCAALDDYARKLNPSGQPKQQVRHTLTGNLPNSRRIDLGVKDDE